MDYVVKRFLQFVAQIRLYHWQTHVYARHKATDKLLTQLEPLVDRFVETMSGKYGTRPHLEGGLSVQNLDDCTARQYVLDFTAFLESMDDRLLEPPNSDLLSIRDELVVELNRALYLFTLS